MPSLRRTRHGKKKWRGIVNIKGVRKEKLFPDATKRSERLAIQWEEETKLELQKEKRTDTDYLTLRNWAEHYLDYAKSRFTLRNYKERKSTFKRLFLHLDPDMCLDQLSTSDTYSYLFDQNKLRSGNASNKDRKFFSAAWEWGRKYMNSFPQSKINPFRSVDKFPEIRSPRYIPPEEDFWKIYRIAEGQDKVMLLTFLHTAARRSEIFNLKWVDIDFASNQLRLWTKKRRGSDTECDLLPMTTELKNALLQWWQDRPIKETNYVFVCLEKMKFIDDRYGKPFTNRQHFMRRLCERVGVKRFGYHAIRHLTASILYHKGYDVAVIQSILRHKSPSTTERYLRSLGLEKTREALEHGLMSGPKVIPFVQNCVSEK